MKDFLKNPLLPLLSIFISVFLYVFFKVPENCILIGLLAFFSILSFVDPLNGINILLTIFPFCLGDSKRSYFIYIEYIVFIIIVSFLIHYLIKRDEYNKDIHFKYLALFFIFSTALSLPLNLREISYHVRGTPIIDVIKSFLKGNENNPVYFLRSFTNYLSSLILFYFSAIFLNNKTKIIPVLKSMTTAFIFSNFFVFFMYYFNLGDKVYKYKFLTASFKGIHPIALNQTAICGFAYNPGYLGQYIILVLPFIFYFAYLYKEKKYAVFTYLLFAITGIFILPFTYQRGPIIALFAEIIFLMIIIIFSSKNKKRNFLICFLFFIFFIISLISIDVFINDGKVLYRFKNSFSEMSLRDQIWRIAFFMFKDQPLLGIGTGKFHSCFVDYCKPSGLSFSGHLRFVRSEAHNTYLHILAEQGIIGLSFFLMLIACIFYKSLKYYSNMDKDSKALIIASLISLTGFLAFGLTQHLFYVRIVQIYFFILIAFISSLIGVYNIPQKVNYKYIYFFIFTLLIYRLINIWNYKV